MAAGNLIGQVVRANEDMMTLQIKMVQAILMCALLTLVGCGGGSGGGGESDTSSDNELVEITTDDEIGGESDGETGNDIEDETTDDFPEVSTEFDGSRASLARLYSESEIAALESLGVQLNFGDNPPELVGAFELDPVILQATSWAEDLGIPGDVVSSAELEFSSQNFRNQTVEMGLDAGATGLFAGNALVSGSGNLFTVYLVNLIVIEDSVADGTIVLSGVVTDTGLQNVQWALFLLDDRGDPEDLFLPEGTGRLFMDQDGVSGRIDDMSGDAPTQTSDTMAPASEIELFQDLFGTVAFRPIILGNNEVLEISVNFSAASVRDLNGDGNYQLVGQIANNLPLICETVTDTVFFLCVASTSREGRLHFVFPFTSPESSSGNVVDCRDGADRDCSNEAVTRDLLNEPDGTVTVVVTRTVNSGLHHFASGTQNPARPAESAGNIARYREAASNAATAIEMLH